MRPPAIVVFSGARIIIVLHYTTDGGGTIYIAQLSAVDKRARSGVGSVFHDFDISNEGALRSESARTTCQARRPASVAAYRPASTFVNSPSAWSFWRWNESFEEESTKFFFRIAEYATGPETKTKRTTARRIGFARGPSTATRAARPAASETTSEIFVSLPTAPSTARAVLSSCTM